MSGTYKIEEIIPHKTKFTCKVSFNGKKPEYFEVEVPTHPGEDEVEETVLAPVLDEEGKQKRDKDGDLLSEEVTVKKMVMRPMPEMGSMFVKEMLQKAANEDLARKESEEATAATLGGITLNKSGKIA